MALFVMMELVPVVYGFLYLVHSVRKRRRGQGIAIGILLLILIASLGTLLWEYLAVP